MALQCLLSHMDSNVGLFEKSRLVLTSRCGPGWPGTQDPWARFTSVPHQAGVAGFDELVNTSCWDHKCFQLLGFPCSVRQPESHRGWTQEKGSEF